MYIAIFNNETEIYDKDNLNSGIIVPANKLTTVFTDSYIKSSKYASNINENDDYIGTHGKGFGTDNLLCTLKEIKKSKPNLQVLYLHAKGDRNLVEYYRKIGFDILIENLIPPCKPIFIYEYIMFGLYDNIINKLETKLGSGCDNLIE